jgi:hypothetical protein
MLTIANHQNLSNQRGKNWENMKQEKLEFLVIFAQTFWNLFEVKI